MVQFSRCLSIMQAKQWKANKWRWTVFGPKSLVRVEKSFIFNGINRLFNEIRHCRVNVIFSLYALGWISESVTSYTLDRFLCVGHEMVKHWWVCGINAKELDLKRYDYSTIAFAWNVLKKSRALHKLWHQKPSCSVHCSENAREKKESCATITMILSYQ